MNYMHVCGDTIDGQNYMYDSVRHPEYLWSACNPVINPQG